MIFVPTLPVPVPPVTSAAKRSTKLLIVKSFLTLCCGNEGGSSTSISSASIT